MFQLECLKIRFKGFNSRESTSLDLGGVALTLNTWYSNIFGDWYNRCLLRNYAHNLPWGLSDDTI